MNQAYAFDEVFSNLSFEGNLVDSSPYGNGHINDTFLVNYENSGKPIRYILQRMNHDIFKNPVELMENIRNVTQYLRKKIVERGGNPQRETLNIVPTHSGASYYKDIAGNYWRAYLFIEDSLCLDSVTQPDDFYQSAVAFGQFQELLADFPAATLHETIVNFHNTRERFLALKQAVEKDPMGRAKNVQPEIDFAMARKEQASLCVDLQEQGLLPLRVTHNDTKLNNVMLDKATRKGICVIDLDTVMPGLSINDFGDSIRFGASTAPEDEQNLDKVWMDIELFDIYSKGFLEACGSSLTPKEIEMMPWGAKLMTFECGMRFLTDYLLGDTYFKIHYPDQNLYRCRTQFKLVADMEYKWDAMQKVISGYSKT